MKQLKAEVYKKHLLWRVKLVGKNGETVMTSETYFNKSSAQRSAKTVKGAEIV